MSKWRTGSKVPINIYDGDIPVAQCQTEDYARTIVQAVNWYNTLTAGQRLLVDLEECREEAGEP